MKDNNELKKLFYDVKSGFSSLDKLYRKVNEKGLKYTRNEVKDFYDSQPVKQVLKPSVKQKEYSSYVGYHPGYIYQMDIIVYDRYTYNKYKYILVVIDVYSRYVQARPMTNRRLETIITNYNSIIKVMGAPQKIQSDNEFNKKEFINILQTNGTSYIFSDPDEIHKNPIVERVNRTIALLIQKVRVALKRYDWNNYLDDVIDNYNSTYHSTTKDKPENIFKGNATNKQEYKFVENPLKVGDKVRIKVKKKVFNKGDVFTLSKDIYIVEENKENQSQSKWHIL